MVKLVYCFAKRRDLSVGEFSRYWREVHGPIGALYSARNHAATGASQYS
jgi:hypothetical protein